jgi:hypothetical protein
MLAGTGPAPTALLVVAADDGWSAQTEEHVEVLDLLAVPGLAVAITKVDLVGADRVQMVGEEVVRRLRGHQPRRGTRGRGGRAPRRRRAGAGPAAGHAAGGASAGGRPRPTAPVGRPGLPRPGRRHGGHRDARWRRDPRGRRAAVSCPPGCPRPGPGAAEPRHRRRARPPRDPGGGQPRRDRPRPGRTGRRAGGRGSVAHHGDGGRRGPCPPGTHRRPRGRVARARRVRRGDRPRAAAHRRRVGDRRGAAAVEAARGFRGSRSRSPRVPRQDAASGGCGCSSTGPYRSSRGTVWCSARVGVA